MEEVPPELFSCTHLSDIKLFNSILTRIPARFPGFNHLVTCFFQRIEFTDEAFSCFSHCPVLERLEILESVGLRKPIISAPNLTYLVIHARNEIEVLIVDCPKLTILEARKIRDLRVNGVLFQEFSYAVWSLKMQSGSNVIVLKMEEEFEEDDLSAERFLEFVVAFKALVELSIPKCLLVQKENETVVLIHKLLDTLPHLERLDMRGMSVLGIVRDPITSCLSSTVAHLRIMKVRIMEYGERELDVLSSFLESCSSLEIMKVEVDESDRNDAEDDEIDLNDEIKFLTKLLYARRASQQARVEIVYV